MRLRLSGAELQCGKCELVTSRAWVRGFRRPAYSPLNSGGVCRRRRRRLRGGLRSDGRATEGGRHFHQRLEACGLAVRRASAACHAQHIRSWRHTRAASARASSMSLGRRNEFRNQAQASAVAASIVSPVRKSSAARRRADDRGSIQAPPSPGNQVPPGGNSRRRPRRRRRSADRPGTPRRCRARSPVR